MGPGLRVLDRWVGMLRGVRFGKLGSLLQQVFFPSHSCSGLALFAQKTIAFDLPVDHSLPKNYRETLDLVMLHEKLKLIPSARPDPTMPYHADFEISKLTPKP